MITFSHYLERDSRLLGWETSRDCSTATRQELLWYFFSGDVGIITDEIEFRSQFGMVPALNFGLALLAAIDDLSRDKASFVYTFTECDEWISFTREGELTRIKCSFAPGEAVVPYVEYVHSSRAFVRQLVDDLGMQYPSLMGHTIISEISKKISR